MTDYWNIEVRRFLLIMLGGFLLGLISDYWLPATLFTLLAYVGWTLYKLRQLQRWLIGGCKASEMPDSDGAWEQIAYLMHRERQKSKSRKKKRTELLMRFNSILSVLPDAAVLLGKDNEIQWVNKSAPAVLGINKQTDIGQRIDNLVRNPELHKALIENRDKPLSFTAPHNEDLTLEASILPVQGGLRLLHVRDISQRISLQRTRKAFIANASHELRTPLTVLTGYMELFAGDAELPEHLRPALHQAQEQAGRMQQIIQGMLELSRLENVETTPVSGKPINMPELLGSITQALQDTLGSGTHQLETVIEPDLWVCGVEKDVTSVITNLIGNAIWHTPAGTRVRIDWSLHASSGHACLSVEDDGSGIAREHLPHLTERFYRVDTGRSRESGGTGLGLAIVKHIMKGHGGYLTIQSEAGQTCFQVCFPANRVCEPEPSMQEHSSTPSVKL